MSGFDVFQVVVIALVVVFSAWRAFRKLMPRTSKRVLAGMSARLDRPGRSTAMRALGHRLQPAEAKSGACGTGDGCDSCSGCAPAAPVVDRTAPQPLHFRPRK